MFSKYNFKDYINEGLNSIGFINPTEIQEEVIPLILNGENIVGKSQTGTGKTHAFILPILQRLDEEKTDIQAVIVVPTRELGKQIYDEFIKITRFSEKQVDIRLYVGGTDRNSEIARLKKSSPQIVIGTIGKLTDLAIDENVLRLHEAKIVVIDEADMVFDKSEIKDIDKLFSRFQDFQVLSFSATIPENLKNFLDKYLDSAIFIDLVKKNTKKDTIKHIFIPTKNKNKDNLLCDLLKTFNPYLALIFANTVKKVDDISLVLAENGFKVGKLTGELEPRERKQVLKRIKDGLYQYVVCTDIAARGMDIIGVSHVINYELPSDIEYYIHRIGRTARFDQDGFALSFYDYDDESYLKKLKDKGLSYEFMVLKDGELKPTKECNTKKKKESEAEIAIHKKHPMPKKVKPGYRKKRNEVIQKEIKKEKKARISEMYRKRAQRSRYENVDR